MTLIGEPRSTTHELGAVLMFMGIPTLSYFVFYKARKRAPYARVPPDFTPGALAPHVLAELRTALPEGEHRAVFVLDTEGFSARFALRPGGPAPVQFLAPAIALPRFPVGTEFRLLQQENFVGDGKVLEVVKA